VSGQGTQHDLRAVDESRRLEDSVDQEGWRRLGEAAKCLKGL